ncbi:LytTR family two component transcriptional regulator [Flammeovirgaceae bacterium 311]|nr:LytTR family two component transcriptional regulator [Flammeovirgaceae bacterium 311]
MTCFIIDDEPLAIEVLESHIAHLEDLEVVGTFENAIIAFQALQKQSVDLIFLDIHMPKLSGIDFLKSLKNPPKVIFTTAYREYAIEGFELDVVDYLLKPISLDRFLKAVAKIKSEKQSVRDLSGNEKIPGSFLFVHSDKKMIRIAVDEIQYLESQKDTIKIVTEHNTFQVRRKISDLEEELSSKGFIRIHRAFLVPLNKIQSWSASEVEISGKTLPVGRAYRNDVSKRMQGFYERN